MFVSVLFNANCDRFCSNPPPYCTGSTGSRNLLPITIDIIHCNLILARPQVKYVTITTFVIKVSMQSSTNNNENYRNSSAYWSLVCVYRWLQTICRITAPTDVQFNFTDNHNSCWWNSHSRNPVRFNAIVYWFVQNDRCQENQFIDTRTGLYKLKFIKL